MKLFLLFLCISGVCAGISNIFDHLNTSNLVPDSGCPPLYYGSNCKVPYCYPEHGLLVQRSADDFFCNCTKFTSGAHCEIVDCNYGILNNSTFLCECPDYVYGAHCSFPIEAIILFVMAEFGLLGMGIYCCIKKKDKKAAASSTNQESRTPLAPAPEIRIVERVVIQERSDAPPTYDSAVDTADPPKYSEKK